MEQHNINDFGFKELEIGKVYSEWIFSIFKPFIGSRVMEVGCGLGLFVPQYINSNSIVLTDINQEYLDVVHDRYDTNKHITIVQMDAMNISSSLRKELQQKKLDTVLSINVFEHIENDQKAMDNVYDILSPGGNILLFVPALPWIYGSLDESFGHYRRYTKKELTEKIKRAGFHVESVIYFNFIGIFWWYLTGKILKKKNLPVSTGVLLHYIVPILQKFETLIPLPIGQSLIIVGKK